MSNWKDLILKTSGEVKITFVCTGNIIRSAYAEYLAKKYFHPKSGKQITFDSGACRHQNTYMHSLPHDLLLKEGYKEEILQSFKPRLIENYLSNFDKSTLFIAMTKEHLVYLEKRYPENSFLLKEIVLNKKEDVLDPYYYPEKGEEIMKELKDLIISFCKLLDIIF